MRNRTFGGLGLFLLVVGSVSAGTVYSDYPIDGTKSAWTINNGYYASDSFIVAGTTLTGVKFGVWLNAGDSGSSVDWRIGTTPFGSEIASGSGAALSETLFVHNGYGYDVFDASFSLPNVNVTSGTYYLTLLNATTNHSGSAYWDINLAPGVDAWENQIGNVSAAGVCQSNISYSGTCASAFQVLGSTSGVPEPGTFVLLGAGMAAVVFVRRRVRA